MTFSITFTIERTDAAELLYLLTRLRRTPGVRHHDALLASIIASLDQGLIVAAAADAVIQKERQTHDH